MGYERSVPSQAQERQPPTGKTTVQAGTVPGIDERRLVMGELTFNINGKQAFALRRDEGDGRVSIVVRESLMNSLMNSIRAGDEAGANEIRALIFGDENAAPGARVNALMESVGFTASEAMRLGVGTPGVINPTKGAGKCVMVTEEVIRKNYGIARTIGMLAAMGYQVFVREPVAGRDAKGRSEFYDAYQLGGFYERGALIPVSGDDSEVKRAMSQAAKKRLKREDVISIAFRSEAYAEGAQPGEEFTNLVLDDDLLGMSAVKRADYPVLLLGARLLEDPNALLWKQLGEKVIGNVSNNWYLHETPASLDMSESLIQEIMNYQAVAESIARAA